MKIDDNSKIIWIVSVNCLSGEILDLEIRVVDKILSIGNTSDGDGIMKVSLHPSKIEYEECGFDKRKVIDVIKNRAGYERQILRCVFDVYNLSYPQI